MSTASSQGLFVSEEVDIPRELRSDAPSAQPVGATAEPPAKRVKLEASHAKSVAGAPGESSRTRTSRGSPDIVIDLTEDIYFVGGNHGFMTKADIIEEFKRLRVEYAEIFLSASQRADPAKKMKGTLEDTSKASGRSNLAKILERDQQDWGKQLVNALKALTKELGDLENFEIKLDRQAYLVLVEAAYTKCEKQCRAKVVRAQAELAQRQEIIGKMKMLKEAMKKAPV
ncbi:hypothetical protein Slin15195_G103920 [Septoria linicola]|uniref:Uncharacterized protein n=1 Tax=Septoria linicola TaxID=215465 RepID=A0A9Q9B3Y8_9PEZI|nr:hypothetical protein Slin15195_G103920 [Septoria linicola]